MKSCDYLIVGAGFAGLATAYYLVRNKAGSIVILEKEEGPARAASGQSASMISWIDPDPVTARINREGAGLLHADLRKVLPGIGFKRTGALYVGSHEKIKRLARGHRLSPLSRAAILKKFPMLGESGFESGLFFQHDGVVDSAQLAKKLAEYLRRRGVRILYGVSYSTEWNARVIVNAAGAWAGELARHAGAARFPVLPKRRHLFITRPIRRGAARHAPAWPIIWDLGRNVYSRPENSSLLLCPCDETPHIPVVRPKTSADVETLLRSKMRFFLPRYARAPIQKSWAGLRTFSNDGRFVVGRDPKRSDFFWVACLDGHGVTASAAVGKLAASILTGKPYDLKLARALSPSRFTK